MPCETRWNSHFDAINRACRSDIKPKINLLIQQLKLELKSARNLELLSSTDWNLIEEFLKIARPVANALDRLQGDKNCSQGYILPTLLAMRHHISTSTIRYSELKRNMLKVIDKRFEKYMKIDEEN